jgi:hypothetical protein
MWNVVQEPAIDRLVAFEKASWPKKLQASRKELEVRLHDFGKGVFLLSVDGVDVAQITVSPKRLPPTSEIRSFEFMRDLPVDVASPTLWMTNIATRIDERGKGYSTALLKEVLAFGVREGYRSLYAGVTCDGYGEALESGTVNSLEEYLTKGMNPALQVFKKAAEVQGLTLTQGDPLPNYWPNDEGSAGYGVLANVALKARS